MELLTFDRLVRAYFDCRLRKRNTQASLEFEFNLEDNLYCLYEELINEEFRLGQSFCFVVTEPKPREVWAADFRDRIVHHLIYNAVSPRFFKRFIKDTYSCIPKRGTMNAMKSLHGYMRSVTENFTKPAYYLKADIKNFFVSINRRILFEEVTRYVDEDWLVRLIEQVIFNDCKENCVVKSPRWKFNKLPKYKSLWHTDNERGLPIGNLTSQFFSNVYLNVLDQYVKHHWHCKYYCRYVDDFVILDTDPKKLNAIHKDLTRFLKERLDLELHQCKKLINKVDKGIDFVGFVPKPNRCLLRKRTLKRMKKVIYQFQNNQEWYKQENIDKFINSMNSYLGLLRNVNGYRLRKQICVKCINLFIGCDSEYTKLYSNFKRGCKKLRHSL